MKKYFVVQKIEKSRRRQRQSGAAENRAAGLSAGRCDVGVTLRHRRHRATAVYNAAVWVYYRHCIGVGRGGGKWVWGRKEEGRGKE